MADLRIHFLNVGHGDCTILHFPARERGGRAISERVMMVDIRNSGEPEYEDVIKYYRANFSQNGKVKPIFRFVCTHPHQDHICGLDQLLKDPDIRILNLWDLEPLAEMPENQE